jgi:hypothetical protein
VPLKKDETSLLDQKRRRLVSKDIFVQCNPPTPNIRFNDII